jgi:hypothetical protein
MQREVITINALVGLILTGKSGVFTLSCRPENVKGVIPAVRPISARRVYP